MSELLWQEFYKTRHQRSFYLAPLLLFVLMLLVAIITVRDSDPAFYIVAGFAGFQWATIFLIVIVANSFSMDFEFGTIKYQLVKFSRWKIFFSKLLVCTVYDLYLHGLVFLFTVGIKWGIYQGKYPWTANYLGQQSLFTNFVAGIGLDSASSFIFVAITILLACWAKTSAVAISTGIAECFVGEGISNMLIKNGGHFSLITRWNPFNMLNITNQWANPGYAKVTLLSIGQLAGGTACYIVLFLLLAAILFGRKRV